MQNRQDEGATRREFFLAGVAAAAGVVASPARAQQKIAQTAVQYQTHPKDGQMCSICVNFQPPNACKIVEGNIVPNGWCVAFGPKS
jgi:hypothetical protein